MATERGAVTGETDPPVRARVIAWPTASARGAGGAYAVRISGLGAGAKASLVDAARRASLWTTLGAEAETMVLEGSLAGFDALEGDPAAGVGSRPVAGALARFRTAPRALEARDRVLDLAHGPLIVGVLNATPDSFYDRGRYFERDAALARADEMVAEGADLIEVGGESARPGPPLTSDGGSRAGGAADRDAGAADLRADYRGYVQAGRRAARG